MKRSSGVSSQYISSLFTLCKIAKFDLEIARSLEQTALRQLGIISGGTVTNICKILNPDTGLLECTIQVYEEGTGYTIFTCPCAPADPAGDCPHMFDFCKLLMEAAKANAEVDINYTVVTGGDGSEFKCIDFLCIKPRYCCPDDDSSTAE